MDTFDASYIKQLQKVIKTGDVITLARLCATNTKTIAHLVNHSTALHVACSHGFLDLVKLLCKLGLDADKENEYGWTPLMQACFYGHLPVVEFLLNLKSINPDKYNALGTTALQCSVYGMHSSILSALLERGVDVNNHGGNQGFGLTALMIACARKNHSAVTMLLQYGADCNYQCKSNGWTPLFYAVHKEDYSLVKILLNARAEPKLQDLGGRTALSIALEMGCDVDTMFGETKDLVKSNSAQSAHNLFARIHLKKPQFSFQTIDASSNLDSSMTSPRNSMMKSNSNYSDKGISMSIEASHLQGHSSKPNVPTTLPESSSTPVRQTRNWWFSKSKSKK